MSILSPKRTTSRKATEEAPVARKGYTAEPYQDDYTRGPKGDWNKGARYEYTPEYQPRSSPISVPNRSSPLNGPIRTAGKSSPEATAQNLSAPRASPRSLLSPAPRENKSSYGKPANGFKFASSGYLKSSPHGSLNSSSSSFKSSTPNLSSGQPNLFSGQNSYGTPAPTGLLAAAEIPNHRTPSPVRGKKLPQINTNPITPRPATPSDSPIGSPSLLYSPGRRCFSEKVKATPASYVRHSRVYSLSDLSFLDHHQLGGPPPVASSSSPMRRSRSLMHMQNKLINEQLAPEVAPVVNLINAQKMRTYAMGEFQLPGQLSHGERIWFEVEAKISGTELAIWRPAQDDFMVENGNDEFTPKYINLADAKVEIASSKQVRILQDWQSENTTLIQFHSADDCKYWLAAIYLAKFEYLALNEAFTAVILSTKLRKLADVHLLLSKKRFAHTEWVNLRLPQVSNRWLKVYMVILALELKRLGLISIYSTDKVAKKNLIVHVSNVVDVFNVYPEHPGMIDVNSIMKLSGDIFISRAHEHLFAPQSFALEPPSTSFFKRSSSHSSLSSLGNSPGNRSSSYFEVAPPLDSTDFKVRGNRSRSNSEKGKENGKGFLGFRRSSGRNRSNSHNATTSSRSNSDPRLDSELDRSMSVFVKKNHSLFVRASYLYLMPVAHPGVPAVETMVRNFMHIIDVFQLYGRPELFVSDKTDQRSMLYGLPSLPHYQYMTMDDAVHVVTESLQAALSEQWAERDWITSFKGGLSRKLAGSTSTSRAYKGLGDIAKLYGDLEMDYGEVLSPSVSLQPPQLPVAAGSSLSGVGFEESAYSSESSLGREKESGSSSEGGNDFSSYKSYNESNYDNFNVGAYSGQPRTSQPGFQGESTKQPGATFDNSMPAPTLGAPIALGSYGYLNRDISGPIAQLRLREEANV